MLLGYRGSALATESNRSRYNLEAAYKLACEQLARADIEQQCHRSGAQHQTQDSQKAITIKYLNQSYLITLPDIEISLVDSAEQVPIRDKILILHYLTLAKGTAATNKLIAFRELPGGNVYSPTFSKRTMKPLSDYFGKEPALLVNAGKRLGGYQADYGDVAVTINAFSRVPITIALWKGDEEFAPEGNLMFNSTISDYLTNDDIHALCETIAWRLVRLLKAGGDNPGKR